jgi:hypothetical protein
MAKMMKRGRNWTPDAARLARGLARAGNDLREWIHYGTVAALTGKDGGPSYTDENAIVISPFGVEVDVVLEPLNYPCTARWGIQSGRVFISTPIHPGDQVVVLIPAGDPSSVPEILRIITCPHNPIPVGEDGLPRFKNDRALVAAQGVPIELLALGDGAEVSLLVNPDGTIQLGGQAAQELIRGTEYRNKEGDMNQALSAAIDTLNQVATVYTPAELALVPAPTTAAFLTALQVFIPLWKQFIDQFEGGAAGFLSAVSKTE